MPIFELDLFGLHIAPTYYGTAYAIGFLLGYLIVRKRGVVPHSKVDDLLFFVFLGVFLGGRLGYVLFYNLPYYLGNPLEILMPWKGGMSFHGGVIGVIVGMWAYSRKFREAFLRTADEVVFILPIGIGLGRVANYLNGELFGFAPYSGPFAMMVNGVPHFPSPLLEAMLEGPLLALVLVFFIRKNLTPGSLGAIFLVTYAVVRMFAEQWRLPDPQIGYLAFGTTLG
jgi:phosphatidylglycerol:prolipoprotein diacylglycerol transferase